MERLSQGAKVVVTSSTGGVCSQLMVGCLVVPDNYLILNRVPRVSRNNKILNLIFNNILQQLLFKNINSNSCFINLIYLMKATLNSSGTMTRMLKLDVSKETSIRLTCVISLSLFLSVTQKTNRLLSYWRWSSKGRIRLWTLHWLQNYYYHYAKTGWFRRCLNKISLTKYLNIVLKVRTKQLIKIISHINTKPCPNMTSWNNVNQHYYYHLTYLKPSIFVLMNYNENIR